MTDPNRIVFDAVAFAAHAHRFGTRKDDKTPYVSHVFRVCLVVRQVFGFGDPRMLAAAILHDTIEDTTTDYDDIAEKFDPVVARWVAALTKDKRRHDDEREAEYCRTLTSADWQVQVCKLADVYDNLTDSLALSREKRNRTVARSHRYLNAIRTGLPSQAEAAFRLVEERLAAVEAGQS